jgi:hypothetical protein
MATKITQYQQGYRDALDDIRIALERGGEQTVREWLDNNLPTD